MSLLIAIPAFNEAATVRAVVRAARAHGPVLVVDDGSADGTADEARAAGATVLRHERRRGKGAALATAFAAARAQGVACVVTLDADGQHDPHDIPALLEAAARHPDAVVVGSRLADGDAHLPRDRALAMHLAAFWLNWIVGRAVADTQSGFRVYPARLLERVPLRGGRFVFETEVLVEALRHGFDVREVPVRVAPYARRASRFHPLADGLAITAYLARGAVRRWGVEMLAACVEVVSVFTRERREARHGRMLGNASSHAGSPSWGMAIGVGALDEIRGGALTWWHHPRARRARRVAVATLASPTLLVVAGATALTGGRLPGAFDRLVRRLYDARALPALDERTRDGGREDMAGRGSAATRDHDYDVVVIGGGPGGSSASGFLAKAGLKVALYEREVFPRFHVGESLMPATMLLLDQLGVRGDVERAGFQSKLGAMFFDEMHDLSTTFYFLPGMPWPQYTFQVPRAEFDTILLEHAKRLGVEVHQPATVEAADFDRDGVTVTTFADGVRTKVRAAMVVDASGRASFMASRTGGERRRIPNLGKVAMFAHFRGAERLSGKEEGNIRVYIREDGWYWWIPLANDVTSVGAVVHARTARAWQGTPEDLFEDMLRRSKHMPRMLAKAERITPVRTEANFAYENTPVVGDRFVAVGDAITFVDPIFSGGVYIALRTGQLAADSILAAFKAGRFDAPRFAGYQRAVRRGVAPLFKFIHKYYEPAFLDMFMHPQDRFGLYAAVLNVLSGGNWVMQPRRVKLALALLFEVARAKTWWWRRHGLNVESRLEW